MRAIAFAMLLLAACAQTQTDAPAPAAGGLQVDRARLPLHIREDLVQRDAALAEPGVVAAGIGETADLGGGLRVRPLEVLEDSRCPQNARCVWAGRLRLRVAVEGAGEHEVIAGEGAAQTSKGAFEIVAVSPGPWTDWPPENRTPYRFGFRRA
ncbi:hypothetical protein U91I_00119 [alpha proteobacterium U9-1i]|nr:hypothetical protein U91I_00119 [alpha proteobacterium U9-1i]